MEQSFLKRAIELAVSKSSDGAHGPFGAVVVKDGKVIAEGWNCVVAEHDPSAHAEIIAIRNACQALKTHVLAGCAIYASSEPCPMCLSAIYWARIDAIYYACDYTDAAEAGFDDSRIYYELQTGWSERSVTSGQALREEGRAAFSTWVNNPQKKEY